MTRSRVLVVLIVLAASALLVVGPVLASHTHVTGEWSHGLTDAEDSDYYLHPMNQSTLNHSHESTVEIGYGSTVLSASYCVCAHSHLDYWTFYNECYYWSGHVAYGLSYHKHYHHPACA